MGKTMGLIFCPHVGAGSGVRIISASGSFGSSDVSHSVLERMRLTWCRAAWREAGMEGQRVTVCLWVCALMCAVLKEGVRDILHRLHGTHSDLAFWFCQHVSIKTLIILNQIGCSFPSLNVNATTWLNASS